MPNNAGVSQGSIRKPATFTPEKRRAAQLLAEGNITVQEVAKRLNVDRNTLWNWRKDPAFRAVVAEMDAELNQDALQLAITRRRERLARYNDRFNRYQQVIEERAAYYAERYPEVPGGTSGLLVETLKVVGSGPSAYTVTEHVLDHALSREMRELAKQAAIELGQWTERSALEATVAQQVVITERQVFHLPPRDLGALEGQFKEVRDADAIDALHARSTAHAQPTAEPEPEPTHLAQLAAKYAPEQPPIHEVRRARDLDRADTLHETEADRIQRLTGRQ